MRFRDSDEAMMTAALESLRDPARAAALVEGLRRAAAARPVAHRALPDARAEWRLWQEVRDGAAHAKV